MIFVSSSHNNLPWFLFCFKNLLSVCNRNFFIPILFLKASFFVLELKGNLLGFSLERVIWLLEMLYVIGQLSHFFHRVERLWRIGDSTEAENYRFQTTLFSFLDVYTVAGCYIYRLKTTVVLLRFSYQLLLRIISNSATSCRELSSSVSRICEFSFNVPFDFIESSNRRVWALN